MSSNLPYAADAESPLKPAELQVLRAQYEKEGEYVGTQTKFNYAWGLIKSNQRNEQQLGVQLLSDIFKSEPGRRRECLYYLALGNYKLGNYAEARRFNDLLLVKEPGNLQAGSLRQLIDDKVNKEGLMGMAIIGGATVALGLHDADSPRSSLRVPEPATTPPPPLLNDHPFYDHNPWANIPDPDEESITPDDFNTGSGHQPGFASTTRTFTIPGISATFISASGHGTPLAGAGPLFADDTELQDAVSTIINNSNRYLTGMAARPLAVADMRALNNSTMRRLAEREARPSPMAPMAELQDRLSAILNSIQTNHNLSNQGIRDVPGPWDIISAVFSPTGRIGDAVFSEEALDQIVDQLAEQNEDSAPGPASEQAIRSLGTRKVTADMMGCDGTAECSICMDDMEIGSTVTELPCKHWFHDHVLGRPSAKFRKFQVFAVVAFWGAYLVRGNRHGPPGLRTVSQQLSKRITLWQSVVITFLWLYICRNFSKVVGLESPEPLANLYNRSYFRATWVTTALDAGFWTAMRIRNKRLRDLASIVFTLYYLIAAEQADEKVRKVRAVITVDHMRVSWNKSTTPYLQAATALMRPKFTKYGPRKIRIPRPKNSAYREPVNAWMYFDGPLSELEEQANIVLDIPGGGFVSMDPRTSDDKLLAWAGKTRVPILSLDYGKAPEHPYPYALNECFDVYTQIVATKGRCVGMKPRLCPRIIISGDSAGGNLAAGTTIMIIQSNATMSERGILPMPAGLILIYPALNMLINSWMTDDQMALIRNPRTAKRHENFIKRKSEDIHRNYTPATPMPREHDEANPNHDFFAPRTQSTRDQQPVDRQEKVEPGSKPPLRSRLAVSSILSYFGDRVITPEMMRAMIILYVGPDNRPDFNTDYLLCPIVVPEQILAKFPKTYFLTGERDPLVDDTVIFAGRLRHAKAHLFHERQEAGLEKSTAEFNEKDHVEVSLIPGISHGFLQMVGIFPQGWKYIFKCAGWINDLFARPPHAFEGPAIEYRLRPGSLHKDSSSSLELATSVARNHRRTPTTGSEDEDAPLAMSSLKRDSSSSEPDRRQAPTINRTKSLVSLGSEEDLLKRRMKGLTMSLSGSHAD
ncbi:hypothetical protein DV735_g2374, partial [Chaetothyriales sp. CBS 134920]